MLKQKKAKKKHTDKKVDTQCLRLRVILFQPLSISRGRTFFNFGKKRARKIKTYIESGKVAKEIQTQRKETEY